MFDKKISRKNFLKKTAVGTLGMTMGISAKSYANILGANDRINFAVIGLNNRGKAHISAIDKLENTRINYLCDVDSKVLNEVASERNKNGEQVKTESDFRRFVESKDIDAISIATPDHWHATMGILGVANGKHVYLEKPCCHNPGEGELLVQAQKKYGKLIQMGTQTRSQTGIDEVVQKIQDGIIGDVYMGKTRYGSNRQSIGIGQEVAVPHWLNWDLWQGPAPRKDYKDNIVHYNWHWFKNWGTGEINNNGIHSIDICRLLMGIDDLYPIKATSSGGRYAYDDDWEFYDTQVANFEFEGDKLITWEGRSCYNTPVLEKESSIDAIVYGTKGAVVHDDNGPEFRIYDLDGKVVYTAGNKSTDYQELDRRGMGSSTVLHVKNFVDAVREGEPLNTPIDVGYRSNLICHLGNISQAVGETLHLNPKNGHILNNTQAQEMWSREYEPGWELSV